MLKKIIEGNTIPIFYNHNYVTSIRMTKSYNLVDDLESITIIVCTLKSNSICIGTMMLIKNIYYVYVYLVDFVIGILVKIILI